MSPVSLIGLAILAAFCIGVGALSYALALASKNNEWMFWTVQQTMIFPVLLLAGMLLPLDGGPGWLQTMSKFNPLTYVVDAERALFNGEVFSSTIAAGATAAVVVGAFGLIVGTRSMRKSRYACQRAPSRTRCRRLRCARRKRPCLETAGPGTQVRQVAAPAPLTVDSS